VTGQPELPVEGELPLIMEPSYLLGPGGYYGIYSTNPENQVIGFL